MNKILIVDDQSDVRELIEVTLDIGDFEIVQADNGPKALEMVDKHNPDLVLLDVMMPVGGMDGYQVCEKIKSNPKTKQTKIVMLTAKGQDADLEKGKEAGADDYFTKPFSPLELLNKVEELLGK